MLYVFASFWRDSFASIPVAMRLDVPHCCPDIKPRARLHWLAPNASRYSFDGRHELMCRVCPYHWCLICCCSSSTVGLSVAACCCVCCCRLSLCRMFVLLLLLLWWRLMPTPITRLGGARATSRIFLWCAGDPEHCQERHVSVVCCSAVLFAVCCCVVCGCLLLLCAVAICHPVCCHTVQSAVIVVVCCCCRLICCRFCRWLLFVVVWFAADSVVICCRFCRWLLFVVVWFAADSVAICLLLSCRHKKNGKKRNVSASSRR